MHALGDHLAHATQWQDLGRRGWRGCRRGRGYRYRHRRLGLPACVNHLLYILTRDPAARAGADQAGEINLVFLS